MMMTKDQAQALTALVNTLRPDWDAQGVYAALAKARTMGTAPELAVAAIRAAATPTNKTPAVIAMQGAHWQAPQSPANPGNMWHGPPDRNAPRCPEHTSHPTPCAACRADWLAGQRDTPEPHTPVTTPEPPSPEQIAAIFAAHGLTPPTRKDATA